jgi:hypothetical protein
MAVVKEDLGRAASEEPVEEESSSATSGESVVGGADPATGEAPVVQESDSAASEGPAPEEAPSEGPVAGGSRPGKLRANGGEIGTSNRRETGKNQALDSEVSAEPPDDPLQVKSTSPNRTVVVSDLSVCTGLENYGE